MKKLLFATLLLASTASAVKMQPGPFTVTQPDGTTLTLRAFGDQDLSYFLTADGTLVCQQGKAFYVARVAADGTLTPSPLLAHEASLRGQAELKAAAAQDREGFRASIDRQAAANRMLREPVATSSTLFPSTGKPKVAVVLVEFSDSTFSISNPHDTFDKYLNGSELFTKATDPEMDNNHGSVARYFTDMSRGQFTPQFDVYGPVNLGKPLAHYGAGASSQERMDSLLHDACKAIDDAVDFTQYDSNGDGNIDLVYVIYAGYSQSVAGNSTDCIYPKSGTISIGARFDGKSVCRYGVNNELNFTPARQATKWRLNGIGLFCHEFCHCMGLPDLYPASGGTASMLVNHEMDYWSLMDAGEYTYNGYSPTELTAWEREALGWLTIDTLSSAADVQLAPLSDGGKAYRIVNDNDATGHEYYVVENVQQKGWNSRLYGHGMMVTHVDYLASQFALGGTRVNNTAGHPRMHVMPADGLFVPEYYLGETVKQTGGDLQRQWNAAFVEKYDGQTFTAQMYKDEQAGDLYPGTSAATALTDTSTPTDAWVYTGGKMGKPLTDIAETDGVVSFKFMGGEIPSAIASHTAGASAGHTYIYNVYGTRIGGDPQSLPKGVYIRDGKKFMVK